MEYPKAMQKVLNLVQQIEGLHQQINKSSVELNSGREHLGLNLYGKFVFCDEENQKVYRIEMDDAIETRIALQKIAAQRGFGDLFTKEEIIEATDFYKISVQNLLQVVGDKVSSFPQSDRCLDHLSNSLESRKITGKIIQDYPQKVAEIQELFNDFKIGWFHKNNCGLLPDGRISIFDYTGRFNLTHNNKIIIFYRGGKQYEIDISKL